MVTQPGSGNCVICRNLEPEVLNELDVLMGDPTLWTDNVFDPFAPPKGELRPSYRRHGAMNAGLNFLRARGHDYTPAEVRRHYAYHTPKVAVTMNELIANGMIASNPSPSTLTRTEQAITLDPAAYLRFYAKGIEVGTKALILLQQRIDKYLTAGQEVPIALLKLLAEQGSRLSTSQASIVAGGKAFGAGEDTDDIFRTSGGEVSPRMGHHRIRVVNGESRPVVDEGPGDRHDYAVRAREDGSEPLPHP